MTEQRIVMWLIILIIIGTIFFCVGVVEEHKEKTQKEEVHSLVKKLLEKENKEDNKND